MAPPDCNRNHFVLGGDAAVTAGIQSSLTNIMWESLTMKQRSLPNTGFNHQPHDACNDVAPGTTWFDRQRVAHVDSARVVWLGLEDLNSPQSAMPAPGAVDRPADKLGRIFAFLVEGFAAYGACYSTVMFSNELILPSPTSHEPYSADRKLVVAERGRGDGLSFEGGNVIEPGVVTPHNRRRSRRLHWLAPIYEMLVTLQSEWRREREIRRAVASLDKLDDRTLRDIGIPDRLLIEQTVRYCHDC
jgi:hypothetical protein